MKLASKWMELEKNINTVIVVAQTHNEKLCTFALMWVSGPCFKCLFSVFNLEHNGRQETRQGPFLERAVMR